MNKRALRKLCAENNLKSPDLMTALAYPETNWDACLVAGAFLDSTGYKLPFSFEKWQRTVKAPVELYFVFDRKSELRKFLKQTRKALPTIKIIL